MASPPMSCSSPSLLGEHVDEQILGIGEWALLGKGHRGLEIALHALAHGADLGGREEAPLETVLLEARDRIARPPGSDLVRGARLRGRGVAHGVEVPAMRLALERARAVSAAGAGHRLAGLGVRLEPVVAVP